MKTARPRGGGDRGGAGETEGERGDSTACNLLVQCNETRRRKLFATIKDV